MGFNKTEKVSIGDWTITTKEHSSLSGMFEVGTKVKVTRLTERGYDIEDEYGNRMCEIGWEI